MSSPTLWRTSARLSRRLLAIKQPYRCLSCSLRLAQEEARQDAKTTHFGFENVPEAEKQSRGKLLPTPPNYYALIHHPHSRRSLLLRRLLLRHNERPNVPLHPPSLERPLRPLPQPRHPHLPVPFLPSTCTPNHPRHRRRHRRHRLPSPIPRHRNQQRPLIPRHCLRHQPRYAHRGQKTQFTDGVGEQ